jgi:hypothetical protein
MRSVAWPAKRQDCRHRQASIADIMRSRNPQSLGVSFLGRRPLRDRHKRRSVLHQSPPAFGAINTESCKTTKQACSIRLNIPSPAMSGLSIRRAVIIRTLGMPSSSLR